MNAQRPSHTKWNFTVITIDAAFFIGALAFVEPVAVLPVFVRTLTDSTIIIGALATIQHAGWFLPQLAAASFLQHRPRKKPFLLLMAVAGRLPFAALAAAVFIFAGKRPDLVLWILAASYAVFWFTDGMTCLAWNDIIAKSIPATFRGRLFGAQQFIGGGLAIIAGEVVRRVLAAGGIAYPANYTLLFSLMFAGLIVSWLFLVFVREPIRPVAKERQNLTQMVKMIPGILRQRPQFRRMVETQLLAGIGLIALPFYVIYAETRLGAPAWMSGVFIWAATLGGIAGSVVWAYLSDHHGSVRVIRAVCWLRILGPLAAVAVPLTGLSAPAGHYVYAVVFAMAAAAGGGGWIGFTNFLLEIAADEERPALIGINSTLLAPMLFMPVIGGGLLKFLPYEVVFIIAAAGGLLAWLGARRLIDPRHFSQSQKTGGEGSAAEPANIYR